MVKVLSAKARAPKDIVLVAFLMVVTKFLKNNLRREGLILVHNRGNIVHHGLRGHYLVNVSLPL